jgi:hypothetical protein
MKGGLLMSDEHPIVKITSTLTPKFADIQRDVDDFKKGNSELSQNDLAGKYCDNICWKYSSFGAATALPGVIPGLGTLTQIATAGVTISGDLALMLRWMGSMTYGTALIYNRDIESNFNQDFVMVLGLWCGVLKAAEQASKRIATKVAVAQFKRVPGKIFQKINQKVGTTILTKEGTKRGGIAVGKLVPFGVGAIVGGSFNLVTMKSFKKHSIQYFSSSENSEFIMEG